MNLNEYLKRGGRGSLVALAEKIDAHAPDVSSWASGRRPVPPARCAAIEAATEERLPAKTYARMTGKRFGRSWPKLFEFFNCAARYFPASGFPPAYLV